MREQLIDRMIKIYGFEHEIVVAFYDVCKAFPNTEAYDRTLRVIVECHEEYPAVQGD